MTSSAFLTYSESFDIRGTGLEFLIAIGPLDLAEALLTGVAYGVGELDELENILL